MALPRCDSCNRPVAQRWRRCPWCKALRNAPRFPHYPAIDRELDTYRRFAFGTALWPLVCAGFLGFGQSWSTIPLSLIGLFTIAVVLASPLHPIAWRLSIAAWVLWAIALVVVTGFVPAALMSLIVLVPAGWALKRDRKVMARFAGVEPAGPPPKSELPRRGRCEWCDSPDAELAAPLAVISVGIVTMRLPGKYVSVCSRHGWLASLGASVVTILFGWWGIPWGPIWSLDALVRNVSEGGVLLTSDLAHELREQEKATGSAEDEMPIADATFGLVLGLLVWACFASYGSWS